MDAEQPHAENENEQDSENGIDDNEINSVNEQDTRQEHINSIDHTHASQCAQPFGGLLLLSLTARVSQKLASGQTLFVAFKPNMME